MSTGVAYAKTRFEVDAREFDPARTFLVQAEWLKGIGCPTGARISTDGETTTSFFTAGGCPTGDPKDRRNEGLLLAKTGPTNNFAAAVADIEGVRGERLKELGYDIRKVGTMPMPGPEDDPRGSHCGAGAPRFNITTKDGTLYFLGCNSPNPRVVNSGDGWLRLRWGGTTRLEAFNSETGLLEDITGMKIKSLQIVFDEGQDTGPDFFGLAVLDNIDVNGTLVGQGDNDNDKGRDKDGHGHGHGHGHD